MCETLRASANVLALDATDGLCPPRAMYTSRSSGNLDKRGREMRQWVRVVAVLLLGVSAVILIAGRAIAAVTLYTPTVTFCDTVYCTIVNVDKKPISVTIEAFFFNGDPIVPAY